MANKARSTKVKFKFTSAPELTPTQPPSNESETIVREIEVALHGIDHSKRIVSLRVTGEKIIPRYRRNADPSGNIAIIDLTFCDAYATAEDVLKLIASKQHRTSLRRIIDAQRGNPHFEPASEAKFLAGAIYVETSWLKA